ncbi:acyltransferase family protein [Lactiplantibacillus plantarum]|uniref:acyltransferase family protein n=1 Tax=Lactiplantibacillus plantarum TaxID=1590 RepID=UPI003D80AE49
MFIIASHVASHAGVNLFAFNSKSILAVLLVYLGQIGNGLFIFSTAYYISGTFNLRKWLRLLIESWTISVMVLCIFAIFDRDRLSMVAVLKSILPVTFSSNWFITAYLLFTLLIPVLVLLVQSMSKRMHLYLLLTMLTLYSVIPCIFGSRFFTSGIFGFIMIYLLVSFLKQYYPNLRIENKCLLWVGTLSALIIVAFVVGVNFLGQFSAIVYGKTLFWQSYQDFPILVVSFSAFYCALNHPAHSWKYIDMISSYSLEIYLIHANILIMSTSVYSKLLTYFERYSIGFSFLLSTMIVGMSSLLLGWIYRKILGSITDRIACQISEHLYRRFLQYFQ